MFKRKKKKQAEAVLEQIEEEIDKTENESVDFSDFNPDKDSNDSNETEELFEVLVKDEPNVEIGPPESEELQIELESELEEDTKDLNEYFEESKSKKELKKDKKKQKKSKRQKKKDKDLQDIKDRKMFKFNGKKYTKVEDFIVYLNEHFLDIDEIAKEILEDENFYGWVSKNSGIFEDSLKEFKKIKEIIEKQNNSRFSLVNFCVSIYNILKI